MVSSFPLSLWTIQFQGNVYAYFFSHFQEINDVNNTDLFLVPTAGARLAKVNTDAVFDASSETVVLYPENGGNLHCFTALTPCAVLDVMGPPYNRADGRDCAYYDESPYLIGEFLSFFKQSPADVESIQIKEYCYCS